MCSFLEEFEVGIESSEGYVKTSKSFRCKKLDKILYPVKVVRLGLLEKYPETFDGQELMPVDCEHFEIMGLKF